MHFKSFFFELTVLQREQFAGRAHSTRGTLTQVAYENKRIELGFADVLCTLSGGRVTLDDLPLTENAKRQRQLREGGDVEGRPDFPASVAQGVPA